MSTFTNKDARNDGTKVVHAQFNCFIRILFVVDRLCSLVVVGIMSVFLPVLIYFNLLRNLFSLSITSSAAASNDDSNEVVFVNVLMNFPELMLSVLDVTTT
jgi:hypothetical protein